MQPALNHKRVYQNGPSGHPAQARRQFSDLRASELYCPKCKIARPVRERLLLVLPQAEVREYRCTTCATSLGTREVKAQPGPGGLIR